MRRLKSPFVMKGVACPVCKEVTGQRYFRQRAYVPEKRESDQHVLTYRWFGEGIRRVHPPFYHLFYCPKCHYTDIPADYSNPFDNVFTPFTLKHFKQCAANGILFDVLAKHIDYDEIGFESALNLHFLAIAIHSLAIDEAQDTYKLARLYLRVAWLFREQGNPECYATQPAEDAAAPPSNSASALLERAQSLQALGADTEKAWGETRPLARDRARELTASADTLTTNPYPGIIAEIDDLLQKQHDALTRLRDLALRDVSGVLSIDAPPPDPDADGAEEATAPESDEEAANGGSGEPAEDDARDGAWKSTQFATHADFLQHLRMLWPEVPLTEVDAMRRAIALFELAMVQDKRVQDFQSNLKLSMLVADLLLRCEDIDGAFQVVRDLYRSIADSRRQAQERLREKGLSDTERRMTDSVIRRAGEALEQTADLRHLVLDKLVRRELPRITAVIRAAGPRAKNLDQLLAQAGIPPEAITHLKKNPAAFLGSAAS